MAISETDLEALLWKHLDQYSLQQPDNADSIRLKLEQWKDEGRPEVLFNWWRHLDLHFIMSLQSYAFWLWTQTGVDYEIFNTAYHTLTPILSKHTTIPVIITTGIDDPIIKGGFRNRAFTVADYHFSPTENGFLVEFSEPQSNSVSLETVLEFLSFLIEKQNALSVGFRQLLSRETRSQETALYQTTLMGEITDTSFDYDFDTLREPLARIGLQQGQGKASLAELLHIRHRALLNSDVESKLVTLWASIESQWGSEQPNDKLLTREERKDVKKAIEFLEAPKRKKVLGLIMSLKSKTRNDRIIEGISLLECARGEDIKKKVVDIHDLRSKCAHGTLLGSEETKNARRHIGFMMRVINELITNAMFEINGASK